MHVEGGKVSHVGKSTEMLDREYEAKNKPVEGVQPDTQSVTIKSIMYYSTAHVFVLPRYILLFYPTDEGSRFLQNMGM
jgi:hypothetical protein